jgi:uncharacterized RDD family membrane protein YckC
LEYAERRDKNRVIDQDFINNEIFLKRITMERGFSIFAIIVTVLIFFLSWVGFTDVFIEVDVKFLEGTLREALVRSVLTVMFLFLFFWITQLFKNKYAHNKRVIAGKWERLVNLFIDSLTINIIVSVFVLLFLSRYYDGVTFQHFSESYRITFLMIYFMYYWICEMLWGRTFGKLVTGTKVVSVDGMELSVSQSLVRTAARFIIFEPFTFLGRSSSGWHDKWSNTIVVKKDFEKSQDNLLDEKVFCKWCGCKRIKSAIACKECRAIFI